MAEIGKDAMIKVVLASHGDLAKEMLNASVILVGESPEVYAFGLQQGESVEEFLGEIRPMTEGITEENQLVFLCDLYGGTPFNVCNVLSMNNSNIALIYGANLPILLEILLSRSGLDLKELTHNLTVKIPESIGVLIREER